MISTVASQSANQNSSQFLQVPTNHRELGSVEKKEGKKRKKKKSPKGGIEKKRKGKTNREENKYF